MELNKKELYFSPEVKTFEVKTEGVICQSLPEGALTDPNDYIDGGDPIFEAVFRHFVR
jgi:hypothetical protein